MKNTKLVVLILCLLCLITACGNSIERKVQGTWYGTWTWEFNNDGTLERKDSWGNTNYETTWEVVDDAHIMVGNTLVTVESLTDGCFTLDFGNGITWSLTRTPRN